MSAPTLRPAWSPAAAPLAGIVRPLGVVGLVVAIVLARLYTVYAVDLPGLGDSRGAPASYDKATLARYLHALLSDKLGLEAINLVAHDRGAGFGFQYAAQFPDHVERYAHLDYPLPGPALTARDYRTLEWTRSDPAT